jgi:hypothetical protein
MRSCTSSTSPCASPSGPRGCREQAR